MNIKKSSGDFWPFTLKRNKRNIQKNKFHGSFKNDDESIKLEDTQNNDEKIKNETILFEIKKENDIKEKEAQSKISLSDLPTYQVTLVQPFQCDFCNLSYALQEQLESHKNVHNNYNDESYQQEDTKSNGNKIKNESVIFEIKEEHHYIKQEKTQSLTSLKISNFAAHKAVIHPCNKCDNKFKNKISLKSHILSVHEELTSLCTECGYKATSLRYLNKHMRKVHKGIIKYPCDQCEYQATEKRSLRRHVQAIHEGIPYGGKKRYESFTIHVCEECGHTANRRNLLKHVKTVHKEIRYPCSQCEYKATEKGSLRRHVRAVHEGIPYGGKKHYDPFTIHTCEECGHTANRRNLLKHVRLVHKNIRYPCNQCTYKATEKGSLKRHIKIIHEGIKNKCGDCEFKGDRREDLKIHLNEVHGKDLPSDRNKSLKKEQFICPSCGQTTTRKSSLIEHIQKKHEGIKYPCDQCSYVGIVRKNLQRHVKIAHEGEPSCKYCGHYVETSSGLKLHMDAVHRDIIFDCSETDCDYKSKTKGNLKLHVDALHKKITYPCKECNYQATQKGSLKGHIDYMHKGIKYDCAKCSYRATTKQNVKTHAETVHSENNIFCNINGCEFATKYEKSYKGHIERKHSQNEEG